MNLAVLENVSNGSPRNVPAGLELRDGLSARVDALRIEMPRPQAENLELLRAISASKVFADFERAFRDVTGLPVALQPVESFQLSFREQKKEARFCALMAGANRTCGACLRTQSHAAEAAREKACTSVCYAGLCEAVVPFRLGNRLIGFLRTGQVFRQKPAERQFQRTLRLVRSWGLNLDEDVLREAYFGTRVVSRQQFAAAVRLLGIFAEHLAMLGNRILIERDHAEPPMIARAKDFIRQNYAETIRLPQVAKAANTSPYNFCRLFKRTTRLTFTQFLSRVRVESCAKLLINPQMRVSEVAFESGFQSLTHFNRVFQRIIGQSPTEYRLKAQTRNHANRPFVDGHGAPNRSAKTNGRY